MATHHAEPNEIIDLETWAMDMPSEKSKVIFKSKDMQLARLVIPAGKEFREHQVSGPITVQCVKGDITFTAEGRSQDLKAGQLVYLLADVPHDLVAKTDSTILLTIIFKS